LGDTFTGGEQSKGANFRVLIGQPLGLLLSQLTAQVGFEKCLSRRSLRLSLLRGWLHTSA
jgi:hypothetical protein